MITVIPYVAALALAFSSAWHVSATTAGSESSIDNGASTNFGNPTRRDHVENNTVDHNASAASSSNSATDPKQSTFEIESGASILKYLNPTIFQNETYMDEVSYRLRNHELVVIHDAFVPEFANHVWNDLRQDGLNWKHHQDSDALGFSCSHHNIYDPVDYTNVMMDTLALFDHPDTKTWIGNLSGRDVNGTAQGAASHYRPGDYSMPHTDDYVNRAVAYVWHLSRDWKPEWGGALYWCGERNPDLASIPASFNTLHLFSVTRLSNHFVTTVVDDAAAKASEAKRLTFNGWWTASPELMPSRHNLQSLPDRFPKVHSRLNLPEIQVRTALEMFDDYDNNDDDNEDDDERRNNVLYEWMDDLSYESSLEESTNSFVINLKKEEPRLSVPPPLSSAVAAAAATAAAGVEKKK